MARLIIADGAAPMSAGVLAACRNPELAQFFGAVGTLGTALSVAILSDAFDAFTVSVV